MSALQPLPQDAWDAWTPDQLAKRLARFTGDWYVVGGWALDLWHGAQTRAHEDLEFAVLADHEQPCRQALKDLTFFTAHDGTLADLPLTAPLPADIWQQWGADMNAGLWRVDMMVDRGTPDLWIYKRDPALTMPRTDAIRQTPCGIRYLAPHLALLFKAKYARDKDNADFQTALPRLTRAETADLMLWLDRFHPQHPWITALQNR
ncbi:nucleotidyltransferase domain-containing protein [Ketogulonicigenium vulgare]|uniref:nucleotidyltransferase domain-containing protein n=1 Tax=Ketogulonicigenium vulgare TaxID=92945 RepID=UPI00235A326B|nr:amino acid transporter [Ketogulonicigenium vulgare]